MRIGSFRLFQALDNFRGGPSAGSLNPSCAGSAATAG
jgi:hypothetical protein